MAISTQIRHRVEPPVPASVSLVLVDFDDTLVVTSPRFQAARRALFARLEAEGFDGELIRRVHHDEVDPVMRHRHGLGPFRLEPAFRETYHRLCARTGRAPDTALADACAALGRGVAGTPPCVDGAIEALRELARALPTVIYTQSGDPAYQLRCVREAGVLDVVSHERVHISEQKTAETFRSTLAHFGVREPATAWMIGNSIRSDINPALLTGAHAILVEAEDPWEYDHVDPVTDAFVRVRRFPDAVAYLLGQG